MKSNIITTLVLAIILSACSPSQAVADDKNLTRIRFVFYEDRLVNYTSGCYVQHLDEHLIARSIDNVLSEKTNYTFIVDGMSTNDKIVISLDVLNWEGEPNEIVDIVLSGLVYAQSDVAFLQESRLVNFEERLHASHPDRPSIFIDYVLNSKGSSRVEFCGSGGYRAGSLGIQNLAYEVVELTADGGYNLLREAEVDRMPQRSIWRNLDRNIQFTMERNPNSANALMTIPGKADLDAHILGVWQIHEAIRNSGSLSVSVSPFGIGGFLLTGTRRDVDRVAGLLRDPPNNRVLPPESPSAIERARRFVCDYRLYPLGFYTKLANEVTTHPYFEFRRNGGGCDTWRGLTTSAEPISFLFVSLPDLEATDNPEIIEPSLPIDLCLTNHSNNVDLSKAQLRIAAFAFRHHLRYDAGLILTSDTGIRDGSCIEVRLIAPGENEDAIIEFIDDFDGNSPEFIARYRSAEAFYFCGAKREFACGTLTGPDLKNGSGDWSGWLDARKQ